MADKQDSKPPAAISPKAGGQQKDSHPHGRPQAPQNKPIVSASGKEVRGVVRLAGKDLRGSLPLRRAIVSVRGIGINLGEVVSVVACQQLGVSEKSMIGELSEQEVEKLEHILYHPLDYGVPVRMLNRQKDLFTGADAHYISSDLAYIVKQDVDHEKDANTWRGYRHTYGQKVRGQHTRSTGRTGMTVGVLRKAVLAKAGAAAAAQTGAAAQAVGAAPVAGAKVAAGPSAKSAPGAAAPKAGSASPAAKAAAPAGKKEEKK